MGLPLPPGNLFTPKFAVVAGGGGGVERFEISSEFAGRPRAAISAALYGYLFTPKFAVVAGGGGGVGRFDISSESAGRRPRAAIAMPESSSSTPSLSAR